MPRASVSMELQQNDPTTRPTSKSHRKSKASNSNGHDCHICGKSNMTLSGLKIHHLTHSGEKPYLCTVCDKRFTCSSNLKKHLRIHNKDYIYECKVCGKTCSDPSNMKKHMTVHSGEKAYVCPSCGKSYSYAQSLRQHMDDVHVGNGEKRLKTKRKGHFPCPECGKVFGYYWRCSLHQARVHAVDRPHKCPECEKSFARETILNKHLQTHEKPFACTECDRRFSFRDQLHKHNRTHSGEKPYQCEICLKSFSQRGSLTEHTRTHTGLKPFACQICGMKFSSSSSLRRHERKVKSCFPAPEGEEIPMRSMFPRRTIYVPTSPINIPRVETRPVIDTQEEQNSYMGKNSYIRENPYTEENSSNPRGLDKISTTNALSAKNGLNSSSTVQTTDEFQKQTGKSCDVNGNYEPPDNQITMVVRCDKEGKISVVPVTLKLVNGTAQLSPINGEIKDQTEPVATVTPTHQHYQSNLDISQQTFYETNMCVTMATSNDQHPTNEGVSSYTMVNDNSNSFSNTSTMHYPPSSPSPTTSQLITSINKSQLPTMVLAFPTEVTNPPSNMLVHHLPTTHHLPPLPHVQPKTHHHNTGNIPHGPSMVLNNPTLKTHQQIQASTNNPCLPTNPNTSANGFSCSPPSTLANPNSPTEMKPALVQNYDHSPTTPKLPAPKTSVAINGEYNNHYSSKFYSITNTQNSQPAWETDVNNNNANSKCLQETNAYQHKYGYQSKMNDSDNVNQFKTPSTTLVLATNMNQIHQSFGSYDEVTTNGHHSNSPQVTLLPSTMTKVQSRKMEPYCVNTEQEDIKPVIGKDVPIFNQ